MFTASTLFLCAFFVSIKIMWYRWTLNKQYSLYSIFITSEVLKDRSFYYLLRSLDSLFKGLCHSKTFGLPCNFRELEVIIQRALRALQLHYLVHYTLFSYIISYFHTELNFKCLLFFPFTNFSKGVNEHTFNVCNNSEASDVTLLKWQPTVAKR